MITESFPEEVNENQKALSTIVQNFERFIERILRKFLTNDHDREEVKQEVFLALFENIEQIQVPTFGLQQWIAQVTSNKLKMFLRSESRRNRKGRPCGSDMDTLKGKKVGEEWNDELEMLRVCIPQLTSDEQQILREKYLEERTFREIVESHGYSMVTAQTEVKNAREMLRIKFMNNFPIHFEPEIKAA